MSTTAILLKFPIFNCEVHSVNKILSKLPQCIIGNPHADCSLKTSNIDDSLSTSRCNQPALPQYNVNNTPNSRTTERVFKLIQHDTTPWKPKRYQNSSSKIIFFNQGMLSLWRHYSKVSECTFAEDTKRADNIIVQNNK